VKEDEIDEQWYSCGDKKCIQNFIRKIEREDAIERTITSNTDLKDVWCHGRMSG
jgi:hypothetical protein